MGACRATQLSCGSVSSGLCVPGAPGRGAKQGTPTLTMLGDYGMGSLRALAAERTLCCLPTAP